MKLKKTYTVEFDSTLIDKRVPLYLNNEFIYDNIIKETPVNNLSAVPGIYYLKIYLSEGGLTQTVRIDLSENNIVRLTKNGNIISTW